MIRVLAMWFRRVARSTAGGVALVVLTLVVVSVCITNIFLSMRAVLDIGGVCADGGPYQITVHCPEGVPGVLVISIWIGIIAAFAYAAFAERAGAVNLVLLFWSALFLSLGWNFMEYGVDPPMSSGLEWGWLIPGGLFLVMGGVPLKWSLAAILERRPEPPTALEARATSPFGTTLITGLDARDDASPAARPQLGRAGWLAVQLVAGGVGVVLGVWMFRSATG